MNCIRISILLFLSIFLSGLMQLTHGQSMAAPAPDAAPPMSNDGKAIEQGLAYVLMIVGLLVTYLIH
ncbi:Arabinogalactan peptide 16 [Dendrobium catenatum]|uniref:Arabinogalactan peptide 16 n=1 Tax=Dendrobium catenatum TaxID=906689 RepID=A0A2I0WH95_9ASPA|nr:Arabinogalactan peptide 16 [Dendrobium catenatum]